MTYALPPSDPAVLATGNSPIRPSTGAHRPMRIGFRIGQFPNISETFVLSQILALISSGHHVEILADNRPVKSAASELHQGLAKATYIQPTSGWMNRTYSHLPWRMRQQRVRAAERKLVRSMDVIICNFGWFGAQVARHCEDIRDGARILTIFHGDDMSRVFRDGGDAIYDHLFEHGDVFLPISDLWRKRLLDLGAAADRIAILRMGIDATSIPFKPRSPSKDQPYRFISVCRLVEKKGTEFTLRALALLRKNRPDLLWHLDIIGDGPLRNSLETLSGELGIDESVRFHGELPNEVVLENLQGADCFVLPSVVAKDGDMEGIPVALMEAMASGLPVISSTHSGIPELIEHEVNGLLAPERDEQALSQLLARMIEDEEGRQAWTNAARKTVEARFDLGQLNTRLEKICRAATAGNIALAQFIASETA